ncbi:MAG: septal ring lytic transglycosylase RlpA family lipoprotein [Acidobacteria bacterium]|nr:MAG: septal ring lytic transglycosylase RlpA family lipoprotein [Acidobacteriota bacterium]
MISKAYVAYSRQKSIEPMPADAVNLGVFWPSQLMRKSLSISSAALSWPLVVLLITPGVQAPLAAHPSTPPRAIKVWSGVASWYGQRFDGKKTASGQVYDMFAATAAHPWLPFGSLLRLTNPKTGHSQLVRINDRGPFIGGRELDVSFTVASRLGLIECGVAPLRIELLEEPPLP